MHEACEIIAKLVDDKKIDGKDAVILMHAVLTNNLKTSDWFISKNSLWGQNGTLYNGVVDTSALTGKLTVSCDNLMSTPDSY